MPKKTLILRLDDNADEARLRELLAGLSGVDVAEEVDEDGAPEEELTPELLALLRDRLAEVDAGKTIPAKEVFEEARRRLRTPSPYTDDPGA